MAVLRSDEWIRQMRGEGSFCETDLDVHYDIACVGSLPVPDASGWFEQRAAQVWQKLEPVAGCLTLVWAILNRASRGWRGLAMDMVDGLTALMNSPPG